MFTYRLDERVSVRLYEESDAEELYAVTDANRDYLARWMPWAANQTLDGTREFIRAARKQLAENHGFQATIIDQGRIVGGLGFHNVDWENRSATIGYWIAEDAQGRGLVTRAVTALIEHAFGVWSLHRVEIHAAPENRRSRAIPERLGFTEEGVLREAERLGDRYLDHVVYGLLASEWESRG